MIWCWGLPALILYYVVLYWNQPAVYSSVGADYLSFGDAFWIMHYVHLPYTQFLHLQPPAGISGIERVAIKLNKRRRLMELLAYTSWVSLRSVHSCNYIILPTYYGRPLSVAWAKSMLYFANVFFLNLFLWPPYAPAQVNGGSRKFYMFWTLSVNREVTTWIFSWSSLNYRVGQKVTKCGIFSDPARKLSALTPERGRIL